MKHLKKYLAAAGTGCILLVLIIAVNNNSSKKEVTVGQTNTLVKESIQTEEGNNTRQEDKILLPENDETTEAESDLAKAKVYSKEDIEAEINQLINTYYNVSDITDPGTNKKDTASPKLEAESSEKDNSEKTGQTEDKVTSEKNTTDTQTAEKANTEKETSKKETTNKETTNKETTNKETTTKETTDKQTDKKTTADDKTDNTDKKSDIVEGYKNIKNYVKPGLDKDSYIVFTTYDIKLYNIDTLVPGMSSLSVIRDENGALVINKDIDNDSVKKHIEKLTKEKDIQTVISKVNAKLTAAVKKDTALKGFIDYLE